MFSPSKNILFEYFPEKEKQIWRRAYQEVSRQAMPEKEKKVLRYKKLPNISLFSLSQKFVMRQRRSKREPRTAAI